MTARSVVPLTNVVAAAAASIVTVVPETKPEPESVTVPPPAMPPDGGEIALSVGGVPPDSNAPISHFVPLGRETPRWSPLVEQLADGTASIAGLPTVKSYVAVGPP